MKGISIMVPAFNEEKHLESTINDIIYSAEAVGGIKTDIIIVDDGSSDNTGNIADKLQRKFSFIRVIHNGKNVGMGGSFRKVIKMDLLEKFLFIAGDNDAPRELIMELFKNMDRADLVFTYFINRELRGKFRNFISNIVQTVYMVSFDIFVMYISGMCIYPTELIKKFKINAKRFSIVMELSVKSLRSKCTYYEFPSYMQRGHEGSSVLKLKNLIEVISTYLKLIIEIFITNRKNFTGRAVRNKISLFINR